MRWQKIRTSEEKGIQDNAARKSRAGKDGRQYLGLQMLRCII
jgi:hypothetical protein